MVSILIASKDFLLFPSVPYGLIVFSFLPSAIYFSFRSDPTENDSVEGLRPNARGPGLVTFGVSIMNDLWSNYHINDIFLKSLLLKMVGAKCIA